MLPTLAKNGGPRIAGPEAFRTVRPSCKNCRSCRDISELNEHLGGVS